MTSNTPSSSSSAGHLLNPILNPHIIKMSYSTMYLISKSWWEIFKNPQTNSIPFIDNTDLLESNSNDSFFSVKLKPNLSKVDYILLSSEEWKEIHSKYGGGPVLEVFLIDNVEDLDPVNIEVWLIQENLNSSPSACFSVSKKISIKQLKKFLCEKLQIDANRYEFFTMKNLGGVPIVKEFKKSEFLSIENTKIMKNLNVCLKFEDINWDYTKNDECDMEVALRKSMLARKQEFFEKIENCKKIRRLKLKVKSLSTVHKKICGLLAELKLD